VFGLALLAAGAAVAAPGPAAAPRPTCKGGTCELKLTGDQLLSAAEKLVRQRRFAEAQPLIDALGTVPRYRIQWLFLTGYVAVETKRYDDAENAFREILNIDPKQTRVRLELARVLMLKGDRDAADHHFRLASQDKSLPPEIAATIRSVRGIIRDQRAWRFSFDFGVAPDTNINNATSAEQVDLLVSPNNRQPFMLNPDAKAKSGLGLVASFSGGVRIKQSDTVALLADADGQFTHYGNTDFNDDVVQLAVGPEFKLSPSRSVSVQAVALQHWYGGKTAQQQVGVKTGFQALLDEGQRVGLQADIRHTDSSFGDSYTGWQYSSYATYERVVMRTMIASASLFARRESLQSDGLSNTEGGFNVGIGGELSHGLNAGLSGGLSYAAYDAPIVFFSDDARHDFRASIRAYLGLRSIRVLGFSPSITYTFTHNGSNYTLYNSDRHRIRFALAHYF
jgi:hypothetical protein